jgi:hypothetical protein
MDAVIQLDEFVLDLEHMRVLAKPWTGPPRTPPKPSLKAG